MIQGCTTGKMNTLLIESTNKRSKAARQKKAKAINKSRKKNGSPGREISQVDPSGEGLDLTTAEQMEVYELIMNDIALKVFSTEGAGSARAQKHYLKHSLPKWSETGPEVFIDRLDEINGYFKYFPVVNHSLIRLLLGLLVKRSLILLTGLSLWH